MQFSPFWSNDERKLKHEGGYKSPKEGTIWVEDAAAGHTAAADRGLTGNQLKILGIVAILIDNIGAVVIQGGILHGTDSALYHAVLLTPSGHYWVIAGQVCRYVGRLGFPILAYLTAEEFVRTRDRRWYAVRMLLFAPVV